MFIHWLVHMTDWSHPHLLNILLIPLQSLQHDIHDVVPRSEIRIDAAVSELFKLCREAAERATVHIVLWGCDRGGDFMGFGGWVRVC